MIRKTNRYYRFGVAVVALHFLVVIPHSIAHTMMHIDMNLWQNIYIGLVILIGPLVSGILLWRSSRSGVALLVLSMTGSLLFGIYYHFVAPGPDNVAFLHPHPWMQTFRVSAVLLAVFELVGVIVGLLGISRNAKLTID
jgi:hypothetical protein